MGRTPPFGFWRFSSDYLDAAKIIGAQPQHEISAPHYYLLGHSIELGLKAFLLTKGISIDTLRYKPYGHNLETLFDKAKELGIEEFASISPDEEYSIRLLNKTYRLKEHEYIEVIGYRHWPQPSVVREFLSKFLDATKVICHEATIAK